jgi:dihydroorotate dehydrogenase
MTDLTTRWLGLTLRTPLVVAACPLTHDVEAVAAAVAAGAGAVVMHSLFQEQLIGAARTWSSSPRRCSSAVRTQSARSWKPRRHER